VADDANELIDKLYRINAQGKRYITRMAQDLIAQAAIRDSEIAAACVVEV
jgi:DNA-binding PadR family transcriptional regulator